MTTDDTPASLPDDGAADHLTSGLVLPDIALPSSRGGTLKLPTFEAGGVAYLKRLTLLVRDGRITHTFYPVERPASHAREVLEWLDEKRRAIAR